MREIDREAFHEHCWQASATVSLWPAWKRNALQTVAPMPPRPVEVTEGLFTDIVPIEPGQYWVKNRRNGHERVTHLYPELGFDWTHYWMAGPRVLSAAETAEKIVSTK